MSFLFVALDYPDFQHAYQMVRQLDSLEADFGYKLNLDFVVTNPGFKVSDLETSRPAFADMKMWNGVRTMSEVCIALQGRGFEYTNIHSLCGLKMMRELSKSLENYSIKIFGVTILTHYDDDYCVYLFGKSLEIEVCHLLQDINLSGLFGAILPGRFLKDAKRFLERGKTLVPAVRPDSYTEKRKDQLQTITAYNATLNGADYLVCGSPITKAENPRLALETLLDGIKVAGKEIGNGIQDS